MSIKAGTNKKPNLFRNIVAIILLFLMMFFAFLSLKNILTNVFSENVDKYAITDILTEDQFYELLNKKEIKGVVKENEENLIISTISDKYYNLPYSDRYVDMLALSGIIESNKDLRNPVPDNLTFYDILMLFMLAFAIGFFIYNIIKMNKNEITTQQVIELPQQPTSSSFVEEEKPSTARQVTFDEVQGIDELKPDLYRIVDCLKNPEKYTKLGARLPKGMILYGPPGTGKTLTARAIAGEAGVSFLAVSGSDFIEKYVGVGASRIRELYRKARKLAPCIVFIDEIDAIGGGRGESNNGEKDQTINALLTELDGFKGSENILTICATNRIDILDPALMRAGRFDLKLALGLPDKKARLQILKLHSKNKKLADEVSIEALSKKTIGFSGAELENILNESALIAATANKHAIDNEDIENAFFKIMMEGNKKPREENEETAKVIAYHESGHTLAIKLLTKDSVPSVTIVQSTSGAGGVTFRTPPENRLESKKDLKNLIKTMYAGRAAEEVYLADSEQITVGASQDIKSATNVIKGYISNYGMGSKGMLDLKQLATNYNIIDEASELANTLYDETVELLKSNKETLDRLAEALLEKETLEEEEIDAIIQGKNLATTN